MKKTSKLKALQVPIIGTIFFIMPAGTLILFFPHILTQFLPFNLFYCFLAIFFAISYLGNVRFESAQPLPIPTFSRGKWLLWIMGIELFSMMLFTNILQTSAAYMPQSDIGVRFAVPNPLHVANTLFLDWGLFPWGLYAILASILAFAYFKKQQPGLFSACMPPLKSVYLDRQVRRGINIVSSTISNIAFAIIFVIAILQLNIFILHLFGLDNTNNIRMGGIICYGLGSVLLLSPAYDHYVNFIAKRWHIAAAYLVPFILSVLIILFASTFVGQLFYQQAIKAIQQADAIRQRLHIGITDWQLFYWAWWMCIAPLTTSVIARVSNGRSLREIILGTLLLPTMIAYALWVVQQFPHTHLAIFLGWLGWLLQLVANNHFFSLLGPVSVVLFMMKVKDSRYSVFGFMPYKKAYVTARPVKNKYYMKQLLQFTALMITAFLFANLRSIQYLASLVGIPGNVLFMLCCLGFYSVLMRERLNTAA